MISLLHKSILWSTIYETFAAKFTAGNERHLYCKNVIEDVPDDDVEAIFRSLQMDAELNEMVVMSTVYSYTEQFQPFNYCAGLTW